MRAAIFRGEGVIAVDDRPKPAVQVPTDAVVRVVLACGAVRTCCSTAESPTFRTAGGT